MKKLLISLLTLIVLLIGINLFSNKDIYFQNKISFATIDTTSIAHIFLADKNGHSVLLRHKGVGVWFVNEKLANIDNVNILLHTMMNLEVKCPVPKSLYANVISRMAANAVKVEVYQWVYRINLFNKVLLFPAIKKIQCYYVGDNTQDLLGTYMIKEGAEYPYILQLAGFNGYLTTRYSPLESDWRNHTVLNISFTALKKIQIQFIEKPNESFILKKHDYHVDIFKNGSTNSATVIDTNNVFRFLSSFRNIRYEVLANEYKEKDSILHTTPFAILNVVDIHGKKNELIAYRRKGNGMSVGIDNAPSYYDPDRFFIYLNKTDFIVAQYYTFDRIFIPYSSLAK